MITILIAIMWAFRITNRTAIPYDALAWITIGLLTVSALLEEVRKIAKRKEVKARLAELKGKTTEEITNELLILIYTGLR